MSDYHPGRAQLAFAAAVQAILMRATRQAVYYAMALLLARDATALHQVI